MHTSITLAAAGSVTDLTKGAASNAWSRELSSRSSRRTRYLKNRKPFTMTDDPVDLESHRVIAAQRVEVMRRKQLEELRA